MSQPIIFELNGEEANLVRAWLNARNSVESYNASLGKIEETQRKNVTVAKEMDASMARYQQLAKTVIESVRTPMEKYNNKLDELNHLHARGLITGSQFFAALDKEKAALDATDIEATKRVQRQQQLEAIGKQLTTSTATAAEKYRAEIARLNEVKAAGAITEETHARAVRKAREELISASGRAAERKVKEAELARQLKESQSAEEARAAVAQRVLQSIMTPQQRYNEKLKELTALRKENRLSEEQYTIAVNKSKTELEDATRSGTSGLVAIGAKVAGLVGGFGLVTTAIRGTIDENSKLLDQAEEIADKYDAAFRRFQAMAGLNTLQGEEAKKSIIQVALKRKQGDIEPVEAAASAMASAGYSGKDASGAGLNSLLKITSAQQLSQFGKSTSAKDIAESSAQYFASQGMVPNAENLEQLGVMVQNLKETPLTFQDLGNLAKEGGNFRGRMSMEEQLATFGTLREELLPEQAATTMRTIMSKTTAAEATPDRVRELKRIGLKPDDVDMNGESFFDVIERVDTAIKKNPKLQKDRADILTKLFEEAGVSGFEYLAANLDKLRDRSKGLSDRTQFDKDVGIGESGRAAGARQQKLALEVETEKRNEDANKLFNEIQLMDLERKVSPFDSKRFRELAEAYTGLGYEPSQAATAALSARNAVAPLSIALGFKEKTDSLGIVTEAQNRLEERMQVSVEKGNAPLVKALEENTKATQDANRSGTDRPSTSPESPVRSAMNDDRSGRP